MILEYVLSDDRQVLLGPRQILQASRSPILRSQSATVSSSVAMPSYWGTMRWWNVWWARKPNARRFTWKDSAILASKDEEDIGTMWIAATRCAVITRSVANHWRTVFMGLENTPSVNVCEMYLRLILIHTCSFAILWSQTTVETGNSRVFWVRHQGGQARSHHKGWTKGVNSKREREREKMKNQENRV